MTIDDKIADAFYDENYKVLSNIFGKKIKTQQEAEQEYENYKKAIA